jgi:hypothetical protein
VPIALSKAQGPGRGWRSPFQNPAILGSRSGSLYLSSAHCALLRRTSDCPATRPLKPLLIGLRSQIGPPMSVVADPPQARNSFLLGVAKKGDGRRRSWNPSRHSSRQIEPTLPLFAYDGTAPAAAGPAGRRCLSCFCLRASHSGGALWSRTTRRSCSESILSKLLWIASWISSGSSRSRHSVGSPIQARQVLAKCCMRASIAISDLGVFLAEPVLARSETLKDSGVPFPEDAPT